MGYKIEGGGYALSLFREKDDAVYSYTFRPPIKIINHEAFCRRLEAEVKYFDEAGGISSEKQNLHVVFHGLSHQTATETHGFVEFESTPLNPDTTESILGQALLYMVAPYERKTIDHLAAGN